MKEKIVSGRARASSSNSPPQIRLVLLEQVVEFKLPSHKNKEKEKAAQTQPCQRHATLPKLPQFILLSDRLPTLRPGFLTTHGSGYRYYPSLDEYPRALPGKLLVAHVKQGKDKSRVQRLYQDNKHRWYSTGLLNVTLKDPGLLESDYTTVYNKFVENLVEFACSISEETDVRRSLGDHSNVTAELLNGVRGREKQYPPVDPIYKASISRACKRLEQRLASDRTAASSVLQLAWTACGYHVLALPAGTFHDGWVTATKIIEAVKLQNPVLSYADLYQLAGVVAVRVLGGPDVPFHPGRQDKSEPPIEKGGHAVPYRVEAGAKLEGVFALADLGFSEEDITALCFCRCLSSPNQLHETSKGKRKRGEAVAFSNQYFKDMLLEDYQPLRYSPYREHVELFARDEDSFLHAYRIAHLKLSELNLEVEDQEQPVAAAERSSNPARSSVKREEEGCFLPKKKRVARRRLRARRKAAQEGCKTAK